MSRIERTAAHAVVDMLVAQGVDHVFCVPGESFLAVLDALYDEPSIRVVTCRHESGAANMADAHGKLTGRPGICMVTRGPGATNASIGIHTAQQDSTAVLLFVGQIARRHRGREAFQEVDYPGSIGRLAKWSVEIDDPSRVDEILHRVFATAQNGRKGPVVIALPEDMLIEPVGPAHNMLVTPTATGLPPSFVEEVVARLNGAERPLLVLGGSGWSEEALDALRSWAEKASLPVILSFRRKDLWDNEHGCYIGDLGLGADPALIERVKSADTILAIGARLGENVTQGYTLFSREDTARKLIHILAEPGELGRVWPAAQSAAADVASAALALSQLPLQRVWETWRAEARAAYEAYSTPIAVKSDVNLSELYASLRTLCASDTIICNGAGNYAAWLHRFYRHRSWHTQLGPTSGAMGYGVPAAIAAKLLHPEREVLCFAGDGCFLMTGQEMATAVQQQANVIFVVIDNGSYGTIRMHQERKFPSRVIATDLRNPDFAAMASAFGLWATTVEYTEEFEPALIAARQAGTAALIHVKVSVLDIAPGVRLPPPAPN
ncbi:MAG: thiamine pyrophosphate-binding protein [Sphingobium sp.]|uniref:thiamine pyrophosphate-dependent enzyme n=1 Tax=Sphingobium sp. TaxID=1912891 RepID=UPI0029B900A1|nr:thiamine pyrophosphate-dependent enzyme [Sphingobium sp.]MDX3909580.1 thiamine pyrophosphate-binding protein [Sphingobium sp.]